MELFFSGAINRKPGGKKMHDVSIVLENRPGSIAEMVEVLVKCHVSIEGGGAWVVIGKGAAHF